MRDTLHAKPDHAAQACASDSAGLLLRPLCARRRCCVLSPLPPSPLLLLESSRMA